MPRFVGLLLFLAISGCMIGPSYHRPKVDIPVSWRFEEKEAQNVVNTAWWEQFNDPVLNELISIALAENKDLMIATARVEEFMGRYTQARAPLFPQASLGATVSRERLSERTQTPVPSSVKNPENSYVASVFASWEIDLWGKLRRGTEAARAELLSTEEGRKGVILSLVTSVASAYVNLCGLDRQLEIAKHTAESRAESYHIFQLRFEHGFTSELELDQAKSQYEEALATIPLLEKAIAQQENALSFLLGRNPGPIQRGKSIDEMTMPAVPAGLPSDLLEQRPDIRQAEQDLIAANARIGVAKALYFPDISLTSVFGGKSTKLTDLFTGPAREWTWAAPVTEPVFTAGAIAGQVKQAEAFKQETLVQYQKTIQNAFRDVEDSLADQTLTQQRLKEQKIQVESLRSLLPGGAA